MNTPYFCNTVHCAYIWYLICDIRCCVWVIKLQKLTCLRLSAGGPGAVNDQQGIAGDEAIEKEMDEETILTGNGTPAGKMDPPGKHSPRNSGTPAGSVTASNRGALAGDLTAPHGGTPSGDVTPSDSGAPADAVTPLYSGTPPRSASVPADGSPCGDETATVS